MVNKRKQDRRAGRVGPRGLPQREHGAFTVEGEIERLGAIGRGMSTAPRWARWVARGLAVGILVPAGIGVAQFVVRLAS